MNYTHVQFQHKQQSFSRTNLVSLPPSPSRLCDEISNKDINKQTKQRSKLERNKNTKTIHLHVSLLHVVIKITPFSHSVSVSLQGPARMPRRVKGKGEGAPPAGGLDQISFQTASTPSSTPAAAPHWHKRSAALRNSTLTMATLVPKQRRLTLSVVAVGEGRGDQWALQGATTPRSVITIQHKHSVPLRRFFFCTQLPLGKKLAYRRMCSLQVLPPSGESTSKPVWNVTLKTWNLDDKQKIMNLKIRMTDELKLDCPLMAACSTAHNMIYSVPIHKTC